MTLLGILTGRLSVSFAEIGIFVLLIMLGIKEQVRNKKAIVCLILAVALLLIETPLFPWKLIDKTPLVSIQFPWRLNIFTEFFRGVWNWHADKRAVQPSSDNREIASVERCFFYIDWNF